MNKGLIIFLLVFPAIIALGFDVYMYYQEQEEGWKLTDLGWLWTTYHPESHDSMYQEFGPEKWKQYMLPLLQLPVAAAVFILSCVLVLIIMIFKGLATLGSGSFSSKRKKTDLGRDRGAKKQFKYNRK